MITDGCKIYGNITLNHLCRIGYSTLTIWTSALPIKGVSGQFLLLSCFIAIPVLYANSVDPYQMPRSAASNLYLHCLSMSF